MHNNTTVMLYKKHFLRCMTVLKIIIIRNFQRLGNTFDVGCTLVIKAKRKQCHRRAQTDGND